MNTQPPGNASRPTSDLWIELRDAGLVVVVSLTLAIVAAYAAFVVGSKLSYEKLGQFGDSFGALTSVFNALAFAALISTVVLQGRELRATRRELEEQSKAQKEWARAAQRHIKLIKRLESVRIQPFIKIEWHDVSKFDRQVLELRMRNVGLGVAIISKIELHSRGKHFADISSNTDKNAKKHWAECLSAAARLSAGLAHVERLQFDDLNRALAPGEFQALVRYEIRYSSSDADSHFASLRKHFAPNVHFQAADGRQATTDKQFTILGLPETDRSISEDELREDDTNPADE